MFATPMLARTCLAVVAALALTGSAVLADGPETKTQTTYRAVFEVAGDEHVDVTHKIVITNTYKKKGPKISGMGTFRVPVEAEDVSFAGKKVRTEKRDGDEIHDGYFLSFPSLKPTKSRPITLTYTLRAPGPQGTRFEAGYAHICWPGQGSTPGSITLEVPGGWDARHSGSSAYRIESTDYPEASVYVVAQDWTEPHAACTELTQRETQVVTPVGGVDALAQVVAWPGQDEWSARVAAEAAAAIPFLEDFFESPLPPGMVTPAEVSPPEMPATLLIRQSSVEAFPFATGDLWPTDNQLSVSENVLDHPGAVSIALARGWLGPDSPIAVPWVREGIAAWLGHSALGMSCPTPPEYPAYYAELGEPDLDNWIVPGPWASEWQLWYWQSATACSLIEQAVGMSMAEGDAGLVDVMFDDPYSAADWFDSVPGTGAAADEIAALESTMTAAGLFD